MANIDSKECQNKIINVDSQDDINITVQIYDPPPEQELTKKKLSENLELFEQNDNVKLNKLIFANKTSQINNNESLLAEIINDKKIEKIMESGPDWKFLKDKLKLEYGRNANLEQANKRAFTIMDCKMNEIVNGYENSTIQIHSEKEIIMKNDLLLAADI